MAEWEIGDKVRTPFSDEVLGAGGPQRVSLHRHRPRRATVPAGDWKADHRLHRLHGLFSEHELSRIDTNYE